MLPWKRREVFMGMSQADCFAARDRLETAGVEYEYKIVGHSLLGTGGNGKRNAGDHRALHYLYVKKEDYEKAMCALKK